MQFISAPLLLALVPIEGPGETDDTTDKTVVTHHGFSNSYVTYATF